MLQNSLRFGGWDRSCGRRTHWRRGILVLADDGKDG